MNLASTKINSPLSFAEIIYVIFIISLICAFRAITSISTGLLLFTGLLQQRHTFRSLFIENPGGPLAVACIAFFLLQPFSLFYTHNLPAAWSDLRLKTGLLFLPLAILTTGPVIRQTLHRLLHVYCGVIFAASLFLLGMAGNEYLASHRFSSFFYYELVKPFEYHPVYFSILVFAALIFLLENLLSGQYKAGKPAIITGVLFLSVFLLLLSSKLVISFFGIYLVCFFISWSKQNKTTRLLAYGSLTAVILTASIVLLTRNPVSVRFRDIIHGNLNLVNQDQFSPAVYFNGIQFRLLEWKFVPELLSENDSWWSGVSPGDAQSLLNRKYLSKNMYSGAPGKAGHGYLEYNTHSQFLESLFQNGIPGGIIFIGIILLLIKMAATLKTRPATFIIMLLLVYSFIESVFQEQYGIVIFVFFPLFISQGYPKKPARTVKSETASET